MSTSKSIIDRLLDTQNSEELGREEDYAETQCDSTQADSDARAYVKTQKPAAEEDEACTTDEDVDTTASEGEDRDNQHRGMPVQEASDVAEADIAAGCNAKPVTEESLEVRLRRLSGLGQHQALHPPPPRSFSRQAEAIHYLEGLLAQGVYQLHQVGLFAREFSAAGWRRFLVDTKAGFALTSSPKHWAQMAQSARTSQSSHPPVQNLYEVLLEGQPCWLYFDLEYPRCVNPDLDPGKVISAFYDLLNEFCSSNFGRLVDSDFLFELDSTTEEKFSKHVIVKRLQPGTGEEVDGQCQALAFPSNAQAGYFVKKFMEFVREQRTARRCTASLLFARAKPKKQKGDIGNQQEPDVQDGKAPDENASADEAAGSSRTPEVCVVDESVYTRNRCFRVLFSSKFGKNRPLLPTWSNDSPAVQLLESLAAGVPEGTPLFRHSMIPVDLQHKDLRRSRAELAGGPERPARPRLTANDVTEVPVSEHATLFKFIVELWDDVRSKNEPHQPACTPTRVQRCLLMGAGEYMVVSLVHNRFCFRKGASHKSNSVYIVINQKRWVAYQKCHDVADCPDFRSHEFALPEALRPGGGVDVQDEPPDDDPDPVSQELLTQIMATPPCSKHEPEELVTPPPLPCYSRQMSARTVCTLESKRLPSRSRSSQRAKLRKLSEPWRYWSQPCLGQAQEEVSDSSSATPSEDDKL